MIAPELLVGPEDAGGLHGTTSFWTKNALNHDAAAHVKLTTIVTNPVGFGDFVNSIASLVHRNVASTTEHD